MGPQKVLRFWLKLDLVLIYIKQILVATLTKNKKRTPPSFSKISKLDEPDMRETDRRSKDELVSDVLLRTPSNQRVSVWRPVRTYVHRLCMETGWSLEDLPEEIENRDEFRVRVREIIASGSMYIYIYIVLGKKLKPEYIVIINLFRGRML